MVIAVAVHVPSTGGGQLGSIEWNHGISSRGRTDSPQPWYAQSNFVPELMSLPDTD